jgi:biofilm PGA synthesis N-glycosyltransferase PgaC
MMPADKKSQTPRQIASNLVLIVAIPLLVIWVYIWVTPAVLDLNKLAGIFSIVGSIQTIPVLYGLFLLLSLISLLAGTLTLSYFPLSLSFELRSKKSIYAELQPQVSVIVPAYNEEKVLANCVSSILKSDYPDFEIILVDDGSQDATLEVMNTFKQDSRVKVIAKANSGKASALNAGMQAASGEVIFFVDADGIFEPQTINQMLMGFSDERVGAVCGNDEPVNLDRWLTRLMALQTHVGTGFVRRALARINCLPIVSGNIGAFRREALAIAMKKLTPALENFEMPESIRPFLEGFIGEDLELTWRVHAAGFKVSFAPRALVHAEVPSTVRDLWKQRVRWARGLLQTAYLHRRMFFNLRHGLIRLYLPVNYFNMVILPILQLAIILTLIVLAALGFTPVALDLLQFLLWLGVGSTLIATLYAIGLDRAWRDLRFLYVIILWIPYSLMMNIVVVWAIILELTRKKALWNKVQRTGTISRN